MDKENRLFLFGLTKPYQRPSLAISLWQCVNTFVPLFILIYLAFYFFNINPLYAIPFILPLSLLLMRIFCFQHESGHGSLFSSKTMNNLYGMFCSLFTLTPYHSFRYHHAQHHINVGKIEKSGQAEFYLLTKNQYLQLGKVQRLKYRFIRNPLTILFVVPLYVILSNVFPYFFYTPRYSKKIISACIFSIIICAIYGYGAYVTNSGHFCLYILLPSLYITFMVGLFFFYIQHNYAGVYFKHEKEWDFMEANLQGSSYCRVPTILSWFIANSGFHHIHHINPKIPNYNLPKCHFNSHKIFDEIITPFSFWDSWKTLFANLYDTEKNKMISFKEI